MQVRVLPPDEWPRLLADGVEPFATHGLPDSQHWVLVVAEQDGRIIGVSSLVETVQNHWWIAPDARHSPTLVTELWRQTRTVLSEHGVQLIHATVSDQQPDVQAMVERLGYQPAQGRLYIMPVAEAVLNGRG